MLMIGQVSLSSLDQLFILVMSSCVYWKLVLVIVSWYGPSVDFRMGQPSYGTRGLVLYTAHINLFVHKHKTEAVTAEKKEASLIKNISTQYVFTIGNKNKLTVFLLSLSD